MGEKERNDLRVALLGGDGERRCAVLGAHVTVRRRVLEEHGEKGEMPLLARDEERRGSVHGGGLER